MHSHRSFTECSNVPFVLLAKVFSNLKLVVKGTTSVRNDACFEWDTPRHSFRKGDA